MLCSAGLDWRMTTTEEKGLMPMVVRKVCQGIGFLLLLSALFLVLSVTSYVPTDPDWNHYKSGGSGMIQNRGGAVGAELADWALQALGCTVALLAGIAVLGAWC